MDQLRFLQAYNKIAHVNRERAGIGTLGEKTLHAVLKNYFEPDETRQEIKLGNYYADIYSEQGVIEIQSRQFDKLRGKLAVFLEEYPVTVVYPVPGKKWLYWLDKDTGQVSKGRVSPKRGTAYEVFAELYRIKEFLQKPNLSICVMILEVEEYRYLNGWSRDKKKGSSRCDRIPTRIMEEVNLKGPEDYGKLIPENLPEEFDSREFAKAAHISLKLSQTALNILFDTGAVARVGKRGRAYLYRKGKSD